MQQHFSNKSQLGAFGEFIYKKFCNSHGIYIERTNFCHTDFFIKSGDQRHSHYVDVKTTLRATDKYSGKRYHDEIAYELIVISRDEVFFTPDFNSILRNHGRVKLGTLDTLINEWEQDSDVVKKRKRITDQLLLSKLEDQCANSKYPRIRFVERGAASATRWTGTVDNLPGTQSTINNADATIFLEYQCKDFQEDLSRILFIPHGLITANKIQMRQPNKRQKNKGIDRVIDLPAFVAEYPEYVFATIASLRTFLQN